MASAGDLAVEVVPDLPEVRRARGTVASSRPIPVVFGDVTLDGNLEEERWAEAKRVRLGTWADGTTERQAELALSVGDDALSMALWSVAEQNTVQVLVDPDGLRARWLRVTLGPSGTTVETCDFNERYPVGRRRAAVNPTPPCRTLESDETVWSVRSADQAELSLPWAWLPDASTEMTVQWSHWTAEDVPQDAHERRPDLGKRLDVPTPRGRLRLGYDSETGRADRVEVHFRVPVPRGVWTWRRIRGGETQETGILRVDRPRHTIALGSRVEADEVFELRGPPEGPLAPVVSGRLYARDAAAWLAAPWTRGRIGVRWDAPRDLEEVVVSVSRVTGGRPIQTTVRLPEGAGMLWITPPAGAVIESVSVGPWIDKALLWWPSERELLGARPARRGSKSM